jgi:hypothetical protein
MKTPQEYRSLAERKRQADKREQYIADGLAWGIILIIIICVLI